MGILRLLLIKALDQRISLLLEHKSNNKNNQLITLWDWNWIEMGSWEFDGFCAFRSGLMKHREKAVVLEDLYERKKEKERDFLRFLEREMKILFSLSFLWLLTLQIISRSISKSIYGSLQLINNSTMYKSCIFFLLQTSYNDIIRW